MTNYQNGKIYEIVCGTTKKRYIGSTCEKYLSNRLAGHKRVFKHYQNGWGHFISSFSVLENNNYTISLIETYPCQSKDELLIRERHWINEKECVNKTKRPIVSEEEEKQRKHIWYKDNYEIVYAPILIKMFEEPEEMEEKEEKKRKENVEYLKEWRSNRTEEQMKKDKQNAKTHYEENKELYLERAKRYREENLEHIKQQKKQRYEANKEKVSEDGKKRYEQKKEYLRQKVECPHCQTLIARFSLTRHIKNQH